MDEPEEKPTAVGEDELVDYVLEQVSKMSPEEKVKWRDRLLNPKK